MPRRNDKALWICGRRWAVRWTSDQLVHEGRPIYGITDKDNQVIIVATCCADPFATLIHEMHHAICTSVSNGHREDEEECVQTSETGWVSILRDPRNKWFREMLQSS